MEHRPTRKKPAATTKRKTTRGRCNPNYTYPGAGPPSSRLRSRTNKNNLPHEQDHQDPPECNRTPVDSPSATQEVNQVQTAATASNRMQIVLPLMLIAILLLINVFFYFRL